jgi:hypothetical protein
MTAAEAGAGASQAGGDRDWTLWIVGAVVVILAIIGVITYGEKKDEDAKQKADAVVAKLQAAGLRVPVSKDTIINSLGNDGGAVCHDPSSSLRKAILFDQLTNGGSFVGKRPIIADGRVLAGQAIIMSVYCPDKLKAFEEKFKDVKTDDVIKD